MKQGRMLTALVLAAVLALSLAPAARIEAAPRKAASTATTAKRKATALHQFTGVVTALDRASLTVERAGKNGKTLVFNRHPEMKTTGDLVKDARVTVWYREEDGHAVAHKVVVKTPALTAER